MSTGAPANAPVWKVPVAKEFVSKAPVSCVPVAKAPVSCVPVSCVPVGKVPVAKAPVSNVPVSKVCVPQCHCWVPSAGSPSWSGALQAPVSHWPPASGPGCWRPVVHVVVS